MVMQPRWTSLYALTASMLALLGVIDTVVPPGGWRRVLEVTSTILLFLAIHVWLRANRRALALAGARDVDRRAAAARLDPEPRALVRNGADRYRRGHDGTSASLTAPHRRSR
jgi:hypothetical protein